MPRKPKRPCSYPGCPNLTDGRYCPEHQKKVNSNYEKYGRDKPTKKRYGRAWKRIRDKTESFAFHHNHGGHGQALKIAVLEEGMKYTPIGDLQMQLDFLWKELSESYPAVLTVLKGADSVRQASDAVLLWYERPADQSDAVQKKRAGYGQGYYEKYAGGGKVPSSGGMSDADCPFLVRIMVKDLRIRKGNGTDTAWTGKYVPPGTYTIVEVKSGKSAEAGWGRLKSGAGWVSLEFCMRL